jgi:transcription elongation GreA/GreB family factor
MIRPMTVMTQQSYYILEEDKALARERMVQIEREILELGPAFHEALNQTSETWHDNAPFDALREKQAVLAAELQTLKETLSKSSPAAPKTEVDRIGIGSRVKLSHDAKRSHHHYFLAGHWTFRLGEFIEDHMVISCQSPLGSSLLGKKIGDAITLPNKQQLTIADIA